jgi:hypothetical protein
LLPRDHDLLEGAVFISKPYMFTAIYASSDTFFSPLTEDKPSVSHGSIERTW